MVRTVVVAAVFLMTHASVSAQTSFDLGTGKLSIDGRGLVRLEIGTDKTLWEGGLTPLVRLQMDGMSQVPESVVVEGERLTATFAGGAVCEMNVRPGDGFLVFDVTRLDAPKPVDRFHLLSLQLPKGAEVMSTLNAGRTDGHIVALSAAKPNVYAFTQMQGRQDLDRRGCSHEFVRVNEAKHGASAARFTATCDQQPAGWSVSEIQWPRTIDLTGCKAIRAWINGDAKGESIKIQLADGKGGARDAYFPIAFQGWQQVTVTEAPYDTLDYDHVAGLNLYYNGIPADQTVSCLVDGIEAVIVHDGKEQSVLLEDFEAETSGYWAPPSQTINLETEATHGILPARFGLVAAPRDDFLEAMARFEVAAGLPSPRPGGVWNKQSPWIKRSYLFITSFGEDQFEPVLALAKRGGFDMILMGQESWARTTGHYEINTERFPGGLESLARTFQRFRQEGFHVGLHFLGASIYPPDSYLTPVPDPRLVHDATAELAADIDEKTDLVPTTAAPDKFPEKDTGYEGNGVEIQIDNEVITYSGRSLESPYGLTGCQRGALGTTAAAHAKGTPVRHLMRSYGYHLYDMDTSLVDEVAANFAKVANACDTDMIYFDGSERLQGDHWYYNARMHDTFYSKLARKDILLQASSYSHYSWHILARSASADGHGDLKGYLDERSGALDAFRRDEMPLDIGWYYGYDASCTPDMYEYILGATIGYGSSMSFQVSLDAASRHPFTGEVLDLINRYEKLRLSGRVPDDMRARLRIDPTLAGVKTSDEREKLMDTRREYRLVGADGHDAFQRVVYAPWHEVIPGNADSQTWPVHISQAPAAIGVQLQMLPGPWMAAGPAYSAKEAVTLEAFDDLAPYLRDKGERHDVTSIGHGEGGSTLSGITRQLAVSEQDAKAGGHCAIYTADSTRTASDGWTCIGKEFDPPLDLSWHKALGFWMRGDANGGSFKVQLLDGAKAADFYITNDYVGWRYQQLPRPKADPIDYSHVRTLNLYYNQLPAQKKVVCAFDDIKALPNVDSRTLVDPWMEVGGRRFEWKGSLSDGQYLFLWPGEPARKYGLPLKEAEVGPAHTEPFSLVAGDYPVRFGCAGEQESLVRARVTLQPPERWPTP